MKHLITIVTLLLLVFASACEEPNPLGTSSTDIEESSIALEEIELKLTSFSGGDLYQLWGDNGKYGVDIIINNVKENNQKVNIKFTANYPPEFENFDTDKALSYQCMGKTPDTDEQIFDSGTINQINKDNFNTNIECNNPSPWDTFGSSTDAILLRVLTQERVLPENITATQLQ